MRTNTARLSLPAAIKSVLARLLVVSLAGAALCAPRALATPTQELFYSWAERLSGPTKNLVQGSDGNFYGIAYDGGTYGAGAVFKMTPAGVVTTLVEFGDPSPAPKGMAPDAGLVQGSDGNFYGTTLLGGAKNDGTVFKVTPQGVYTTLVEFTKNGGTNKGAYPVGTLVQGSDGNFYGTTSQGGTNNLGTVFRMTPAGKLTTLVKFTGNGATDKGANPQAGLVQGSDGNFYGTTSGGEKNDGTIFKMTPAGVLTTLVEFTNSGKTAGADPSAELVQGSDGNFYGTTAGGGDANGDGTVFQMTPAGVFKTLVEFTGNGATNKGAGPLGLVQGSDGNFYGTTSRGGAKGFGTVFKMTSAGVLTTLVSFTDFGATNKGKFPKAGLVQGNDGNFYGTTYQGSAMGFGTIFKMTPAGVLTTLVKFDYPFPAGYYPLAGLVQRSDGNFYGTTSAGGNSSNAGTVFKITPAGVLTTLVRFSGASAPNLGSDPTAGLVPGSDGNFYGTTSTGGASNLGTVFKMTPAGAMTTLAQFNNAAPKGTGPNAALVPGSDGNFYGTTVAGGANSAGTVFQITHAGVLTTLVDFTDNGGTNRGKAPSGALVQGTDGNFYGTTSTGGALECGTVFQMTPAGVLTTLVDFTGNGATNIGQAPTAGLVQSSDGNFYGTTSAGGASNLGTVFQMTPAGVLTTLVQFDNVTIRGSSPQAALVQRSDGNFYGTTNAGGANNTGTVFQMTPAGVLTTLVEFEGLGLTNNTGAIPNGLIQGMDGNFYVTTSRGGPGELGTIFRLRFGPTPETLDATSVASTAATLRGQIHPNGNATTVSFQYGTSAKLAGASSVGAGTVRATADHKTVSLPISGLAPGTRYYFRIVGQNVENTQPQQGEILSFTTAP